VTARGDCKVTASRNDAGAATHIVAVEADADTAEDEDGRHRPHADRIKLAEAVSARSSKGRAQPSADDSASCERCKGQTYGKSFVGGRRDML
jgi:hypothetical protein